MNRRNLSLYFGGDILEKSIPFLLIPVLTRYMSTDEYGIAGVGLSIFQFLLIIVAANIRSLLSVSYFKKTKKEFSDYIYTFYCVSTVLALICFSLLNLGYNYFSISEELSLTVINFLLFAALAQASTYVLLTLFRVQEKAASYVALQLAITAANFIVSVVLVVFYDLGSTGRLIGVIASGLLMGCFSLYIVTRKAQIRGNPNKKSLRDLIEFCLPLWPHVASNWVRSNMDRILIASFIGASEAALYIVAQQLTLIVNFAAMALNKAYQPHLFRNIKSLGFDYVKKAYKKNIVGIGLLVFGSVLFGFFALVALPLYVGEEFQSATRLILPLSLAAGFNAGYIFLTNYIFYFEKTAALAKISVFSSMLHFFIAFLLIPKYGAMGAVYASIASYSTMLLAGFLMSNRLVQSVTDD